MFRSYPGDPGAWPQSGIPRLSHHLKTDHAPFVIRQGCQASSPRPKLPSSWLRRNPLRGEGVPWEPQGSDGTLSLCFLIHSGKKSLKSLTVFL